MSLLQQGSQADFTFKIQGAPDVAVVDFSGSEKISTPFEFFISLASADRIYFDDVLRQEALLTIEAAGGARYFHGIISQFDHTGKDGLNYLYRACLVPFTQLLSLERDCRIFQNKNVQDIIANIFSDSKIPSDRYDFKLRHKERKRHNCVQYRETDLDFISRILAEEGIFYFYTHASDKHVMVFGDDPGIYPDIPGAKEIAFRSSSGLNPEDEAVSVIDFSRRLRPGAYAQTNYNFKKVSVPLSTQERSKDEKIRSFEVYDYPGLYGDADRGKMLARARLDALTALQAQAKGESNCPRMLPGHVFTLAGHDVSSFNADYLLISVSHEGRQSQALEERSDEAGAGYSNVIKAIPAKTAYRPSANMGKPCIRGIQTATVVGPANEEIYVDEHGRVKVHFHWDRKGKKDEQSSCWLRCAQTWGGQGWGSVFIPRIGDEVIVSFMEGDPDWPIITGSVYNADRPPLYDLPANKTRTSIKTKSYPNSNGFNELRFEDLAGSEEIYLQGEKDWNILIKNNKGENVGHDETLSVVNNRAKTVGVNQSESIGANKNILVGGSHSESIGGSMMLTVGANKTDTTAAVSAETVGAAKVLTVGGAYQVSVGGGANLTVGGASGEEVGGVKTVLVGGSMMETIGGDRTQEVFGEFVIRGKKIDIQADDEISVGAGSASVNLKGGAVAILGAGILLKADSNVKFKGSKVNVDGPGSSSSKKSEMSLSGLEAKITSVSFSSGAKITVEKKPVSGPHFKEGEKNEYEPTGYQSIKEYGVCSKKPAVYIISENAKGCFVEVEIDVTKLEKVSGTGVLKGTLLNLEMEGEFPLGKGKKTVKLKIKKPPTAIKWYKGNVLWRLSVKGKNKDKVLNQTFVEVFFILDKPAAFFNNGVWAEALRFLCKRAGVLNAKDDKMVANKVTRYCHGSHGLKYNSSGGGSSCYGGPMGLRGNGGVFYLNDYLKREFEFANCYDQAAAIQALCGAVGVSSVLWVYMNPFGFINQTNLLGYGTCNNPFFEMNGSKPVVDRNDPSRTPFGNHAFCSGQSKYFDACGGPHLGDSQKFFITSSIDNKTTLYGVYGMRPGVSSDMRNYAGVTGVE